MKPNLLIVEDDSVLGPLIRDFFEGNERVVDTHIKKLRKAIDGSGCKITTVHRSGYRMEVSST